MPNTNFWFSSGAAGGGGDPGEPIDQSVRFAADSVLHRDFSSAATSNTTGTFSFWVKKAKPTGEQSLVMRDNNHWFAAFTSTSEFAARRTGAGYSNFGSAKYRDPTAWYHFVVSINNNTATAWVNGTQISTTVTTDDIFTADTNSVRIGSESTTAASSNLDGYLAEFIFVDGQALDEEDFGRFNEDGVWVPIEYEGTFGNNGYHLDFADSSNPGNDVSGNNNDFTAVGIDTEDVNPFLSQFTATVGSFVTDKALAFDGDTSTRCFGDGNGTFRFAPDPAIPFDSLRIFSVGGTTTTFNWDGNSTVANTASGDWRSLNTGGSGGSISTTDPLTIVGSGGGRPEMNALEVTVNGVATIITSAITNDVDFEDTPTSNYATYNPIVNNDPPTLAGANLDATEVNNGLVWSTQELPNEHLYAEFIRDGASDRFAAGVGNADDGFEVGAANDNDYAFMIVYSEFGGNNSIFNENTTATQTGLTAYSTGDVLGVEWRGDLATRQVNFYINGTQVGNSENVAAGGNYHFAVQRAGGSNPPEVLANFGQMPFIHAPAGVTNTANGMQTNNLPEPTIKNGSDHFRTLTGSGANILAIAQGTNTNGTNWNPDVNTGFTNGLWWIKDRITGNHNAGTQNQLVDSVRGSNLAVTSPNTQAELAFTTPSNNSVAWCWNAGGAASTNTDGTNSNTVNVAANRDAGFSIVTYEGEANNSPNTIGHGLNAIPECILVKRRDVQDNWAFYHVSLGNDRSMELHDPGPQSSSSSAFWNSTTPTSTVFSVGNGGATNEAGGDYVAYVWAPKEGYSKFSSYVGNLNQNSGDDGPFVYLGFRPAFVLFKCATNTENWQIFDSVRNTANPVNTNLSPNGTSEEGTSSAFDMDFLANGFKLRNSNANLNTLNNTFVYMAFAESPFGGDNTPPSNAR